MKANARISEKAVEVIVKSIDLNKLLGIGYAVSDMDYPTTSEEITDAFRNEIADLGLANITQDSLESNFTWDEIETNLYDYENSFGHGTNMSRDYDNKRWVVSWYIINMKGEWTVVVRNAHELSNY
jgi:hypothetical protein